jgi:acetyltransferase-like isoleucine patch superfamily enzyme
MRQLLDWAGQRLKGPDYRLDPAIGFAELAGLATRRFVWAVRGFLRGGGIRRCVFVGAGVRIRNRRFLTLGSGVTLQDGVQIDALARDGVVLGTNVNIGPYTLIQATGVFTRLGTGLHIGDNSGIGAFSFIGAGGGVTIGSNVIMGQYVSFHSENHVFTRVDVPIKAQGVTREGISIGDDCWIGAKATFLDGAHVGRGCVVAAGSVVKGTFPDYSVIAGVPARIVRTRLAGKEQRDANRHAFS